MTGLILGIEKLAESGWARRLSPHGQQVRNNMNANPRPEQLRTVIPTQQIQKRVREMARQISNDYQGKTIHALGAARKQLYFYGRPGPSARSARDLPIDQAALPQGQENTPAGFLEICCVRVSPTSRRPPPSPSNQHIARTAIPLRPLNYPRHHVYLLDLNRTRTSI